jgi:hypothetical protein
VTKAESARLYRNGAFGNHARQWLSFHEFAQDAKGRAACDEFALRARWPNGIFVPHLKNGIQVGLALQAAILEEHALGHGTRQAKDFYVSEMIDNRDCILNAEVMRDECGRLYMYYATTPQTMRDGLRDAPQHATGLKAKIIIEHLCCARGSDAVFELLDEYPDHVVEFAAFRKPVGLLDWWTIPWEVRDY